MLPTTAMANIFEPHLFEERREAILADESETLVKAEHIQDAEIELLPLPAAWDSSREFGESDAFGEDGTAGGLGIDWGEDLIQVVKSTPPPVPHKPAANGPYAKHNERGAYERFGSEGVARRDIPQSPPARVGDDQDVKDNQRQDSGRYLLWSHSPV